ncbi:hypothetical protein KVV02_004633 [Mortierella alpina]|uniref:Uncharacterized protein n=1 Tax=Mortierella alpina TaxID=64518 RepID=A0A9P8A040_MORAP|nr:hypothetical protein BGZ67_001892 [Mortierella alpina]KAG9319964.1 hypothetical protein KVV02_004633 [Mortierella alpina]
MTHSTPATASMTNSNNTGAGSSTKARRLSLTRLFNGKTKAPGSMAMRDESQVPPVPAIPAHYRHSMAPSMDIQSQLVRERRKSLAALSESNPRAVSLDLKHPVEMTDKMRQFDELLQKRRGSTIRISLTPSLLQEESA